MVFILKKVPGNTLGHFRSSSENTRFSVWAADFPLKTEGLGIDELLIFKSNVLRKFTSFFSNIITAVYALKTWEKCMLIWIKKKINRRNTISQALWNLHTIFHTHLIYPGSQIGVVCFFKNHDQGLDTLIIFYSKLTLYGFDENSFFSVSSTSLELIQMYSSQSVTMLIKLANSQLSIPINGSFGYSKPVFDPKANHT